MNVDKILNDLEKKHPGENEYLQAVREVLESIARHKKRNLMTSFGVAWAIFIFMILFGTGQGLNEGVLRLFGHFAKNSIWLVGGRSSKVPS